MNFIKKLIYRSYFFLKDLRYLLCNKYLSNLNKSYDLIYHYSFVVLSLPFGPRPQVEGLNKNSRMFKLLINFLFKFKNFHSSKYLIPMDKILFYKKSRNDKGDINLLVFIDFKFISLKPLSSLDKNLLVKLINRDLFDKNLNIMKDMLYDLFHTPHLFIVKDFIFNRLDNINLTDVLINFNNITLFNDLQNNNFKKPGVYIYTLNNKKYRKTKYIDNIYIGSSINTSKRINEHKKKFYSLSLDPRYGTEDKFFQFGLFYSTTNYLLEFKKLYPEYKLSLGEFLILKKLTDFNIRTVEQIFIDYYKPNLNVMRIVPYRFVEWRKVWLFRYNKESEYKSSIKLRVYFKVDLYWLLTHNRLDLLINYRYDYEILLYTEELSMSKICNRLNLDIKTVDYYINKPIYFKIKIKSYQYKIRIEEANVNIKPDNVITIQDKD
jgi:DNA-binding CsgD family transcriptional regulator